MQWLLKVVCRKKWVFRKCNFYHELTLLSHASLIVHNLELLQLRDGTFISLLPLRQVIDQIIYFPVPKCKATEAAFQTYLHLVMLFKPSGA
jgi:hypothetical protein